MWTPKTGARLFVTFYGRNEITVFNKQNLSPLSFGAGLIFYL